MGWDGVLSILESLRLGWDGMGSCLHWSVCNWDGCSYEPTGCQLSAWRQLRNDLKPQWNTQAGLRDVAVGGFGFTDVGL